MKRMKLACEYQDAFEPRGKLYEHHERAVFAIGTTYPAPGRAGLALVKLPRHVGDQQLPDLQ